MKVHLARDPCLHHHGHPFRTCECGIPGQEKDVAGRVWRRRKIPSETSQQVQAQGSKSLIICSLAHYQHLMTIPIKPVHNLLSYVMRNHHLVPSGSKEDKKKKRFSGAQQQPHYCYSKHILMCIYFKKERVCIIMIMNTYFIMAAVKRLARWQINNSGRAESSAHLSTHPFCSLPPFLLI